MSQFRSQRVLYYQNDMRMEPTPMANTSDELREIEKRKQLVALLTEHQRRIFGYIHMLVPSPHDAEDILQETCQVICEKFDEFTPGTDFAAWACQIAWWRVRAARTKYARSKVVFNDDVLEALSATASALHDDLNERGEALTHCLEKLPPRDRQLVLARYEHGATVADAAERSGRSIETAYKALMRIRKLLFDCVTHRLSPSSLSPAPDPITEARP
jgi:RNA polymerase sigma-70 factor, ECF subfamily